MTYGKALPISTPPVRSVGPRPTPMPIFSADLSGVARPRWTGFPVPKVEGRMLLWAHRGASALETENTRAALERAYWDGADGAEIDVMFTKDGVPILFHDETTGRIAADGTNLRISETNWADLKDLELVGGEKIMTFDELISDFMPKHPGFLLNIEIKWEPDKQRAKQEWAETRTSLRQRGARVAQLLSGAPELWSRLYVSSFSPETLAGFRQENQQIPSALLHAPELNFIYEGSSLAKVATRVGAQAVHPRFNTVQSGQLDPKQFAAANFPVHSFTVDDPSVARLLEKKGVAGIFTNDPARMGAQPRRRAA